MESKISGRYLSRYYFISIIPIFYELIFLYFFDTNAGLEVMKNTIKHHKLNQKNYSKNPSDFKKLEDLNSYLIYRDVSVLLEKHLFNRISVDHVIHILDIGCSVGTSIIHFSQKIKSFGFNIKVTGIDLNAVTLNTAAKRLPDVKFKQITIEDSLKDLGKFDLIICNFVLVEMSTIAMQKLLIKAQKLLHKKGIMVVSNPTTAIYRAENRWYGLNNQFITNRPSLPPKTGFTDWEFTEDQAVTLQIIDPITQKEIVTFHDFLHTEKSYDAAYNVSNLRLLDRHKPLGKLDDEIQWLDEKEKPRLMIDVVTSILS